MKKSFNDEENNANLKKVTFKEVLIVLSTFVLIGMLILFEMFSK